MIDGIQPLQLLWFLLIALLFIIFFFTEGFDFGVGIATRLIARNDRERRLMVHTIGPIWDSNEVWLVTAGGAMFASFSAWYASLFSGYYILLFLTLFALIIRGVSFEFSSHAESRKGFNFWNWALFFGSLLAPFFLCMMFGSLIQGVPIDAQGNMSLGFWNIVNWLSIVTAVAGVLLSLIHGLNFLRLRIDDPELSERAQSLNNKLYILAYIGEVVFALLVIFQTDFFEKRPISSICITIAIVVFTILSQIFNHSDHQAWAFIFSGLTLTGVVALLFNGLFPNVLIAQNPAHTISIAEAANGALTLEVMTIVACILLPIAIAYIIWTYYIFRHRIKLDDISDDFM